MTITRTVPGLPFDLSPSSGEAWTTDEATATLTAAAAAHSDIFIDPGADSQLNAESMLNAATLLGVPPEGDFQFSARVTVDFESTFDAGVLLLWIDDRNWGKLCFEFSPDREPMMDGVAARLPNRSRLRLPRIPRRQDLADDPLLHPRRHIHARLHRLRGTVADR